MVRPQNPVVPSEARKADAREGYGPGNPEPGQYKATAGQTKKRLP